MNNDNNNNKSNFPLDNNENTPFDLPKDYFVSFEDKIKRKIEFETELSEFPLLCSFNKQSAFTTPTDYFQLNENLLEYKSELTAYSKLESIKKPIFNELDEIYKKDLSSSIIYKVELSDELLPYSTLNNLEKETIFITPENYFETFTDRVKENIYSKKASSTLTLNSILGFLLGKKIAFAFVIICMISIIFYFNQPSGNIINSSDCKTIACLEKQEILNNKALSNFDEDQLIDLVDVKSLNKQLQLTEHKSDSLSVKDDSIFNDLSTNDLLDEI